MSIPEKEHWTNGSHLKEEWHREHFDMWSNRGLRVLLDGGSSGNSAAILVFQDVSVCPSTGFSTHQICQKSKPCIPQPYNRSYFTKYQIDDLNRPSCVTLLHCLHSKAAGWDLQSDCSMEGCTASLNNIQTLAGRKTLPQLLALTLWPLEKNNYECIRNGEKKNPVKSIYLYWAISRLLPSSLRS